MTSQTPTVISQRQAVRGLFAAALVAGLSASTAFVNAQDGYHPGVSHASLITNNAILAEIESRLVDGTAPATDIVTLVLPPPSGQRIPTDKEYGAAVASLVTDILNGTESYSVADVVRESAQYRPAKAATTLVNVANTIIATQVDPVQREAQIEAATFETAAVYPTNAATAAANVIKSLVLSSDVAVQSLSDDAAAQAIAANSALANKIVSSAIAGSAKATTPQYGAITTASTIAAIDNGASYLLEEIIVAANTAAAKLPGSTDVAQIQTTTEAFYDALAAKGVTGQALYVLAGAAAQGANPSATVFTNITANTNAVRAALQNKLSGADETSALQAVDAFQAVKTIVNNGPGVQTAVRGLINTGNANEAAAIAAGATAAQAKFADLIAAAALEAAYDTTGAVSDDSAPEIVTGVVRANPLLSAKIATAVINEKEDTGDTATITDSYGDLLGAVVTGTTRDLVGAAVNAGVKAINTADRTAGAVSEVLTKTIDAAEAVGFNETLGVITLNAAKVNTLLAADVVGAAITAADLDTNPAAAGAIVAGAIVANKKVASTTQANAEAAAAGDGAAVVAIVTKSADLAEAVLLNTKAFFNTTKNAFETAPVTADEAVALVYASSLANVKGALPVAALAVRNSSASAADIITAAKSVNFKVARNIEIAVTVADRLKNNSSGLFEYLVDQVNIAPANVADVVTGAVVQLPDQAHRIGHAAGYRGPASASKFVPALYAFSRIDTDSTDRPGSAAAIIAGVTTGILESRIDLPKLTTTKQNSYLKAAVSAAVKSVVTLPLNGPQIQQVTGTANGSDTTTTITSVTPNAAAGVVTGYVSQVVGLGETTISTDVKAVLTAAGAAAKGQVLELAQAAATAAAYVSGSKLSFTAADIVAAFVASKSKYTEPQILAAVNFGIQQSNLITSENASSYAAGAAGVRNFQHQRSLNDPVTSIFDL